MHWDDVATNGANPDVRRTEYVIAYLSLGAGQSQLTTMQAANVANGTPDGAGDAGYTAQEADIDAIATAHCAIAAATAQGANENADLQAFQSGNYAGVKAAGTCGTGCPSECGCLKSTNRCVAPWLGDSVPVDAGVGSVADLGAGVGGVGGGSGTVGGDLGAPVGTPPVTAHGCSCQMLGAADAHSLAGLALAFFTLAAAWRMQLRRRRTRSEMK
jgi:MYXO-CTERM domain-containing protein